jgi:hypothetical protein
VRVFLVLDEVFNDLDLSFKTFSERAKPEQSGDAKPRVLTNKDSRVAEEMSLLPGNRYFTDTRSALIFGL